MNRIGSGGQYFRSFDLLFSNSRQRGVSFVSLERKIEREDAPGSVFGVLHANSIKIYHLVSMGCDIISIESDEQQARTSGKTEGVYS